MKTYPRYSYNEGDAVLKTIIATIIVALVAAGLIFAILRRNIKTESGPPVFNEAQKIEVLEQLTSESRPQPNAAERLRILESLQAESKLK